MSEKGEFQSQPDEKEVKEVKSNSISDSIKKLQTKRTPIIFVNPLMKLRYKDKTAVDASAPSEKPNNDNPNPKKKKPPSA